MKYTVTALDRSGMGHPNYHTPGRSWPSGKPVEVEVLDQDLDPMLERMVEGQKRLYSDPVRIGKSAWQRILSDKKLTVRAVGDNAQDVQGLAEKLTAAERSVLAANARADAAEARLRQLEQEGPKVSQVAQQEAVRLQRVVDKMAEEIDLANARANSAEEAAGRLTAERDELQAQLEQLTAPAAPKGAEPTAAQPKGKSGKR